MKILILGDVNSPHTFNWVKYLSQNNIQVAIFSLNKCDFDWYDNLKSVKKYSANIKLDVTKNREGSYKKLAYVKSIPMLRKIISSFKPDILHSFSLSSYGILASLLNFSPTVQSVWGLDILSFPYKNSFFYWLTKFALDRSNLVFATSNYLMEKTKTITKKEIEVIKYGVDTKRFKCIKRPFSDEVITIGTIKSLKPNYRIDLIIKAYSLLKLDSLKNIKSKLLIIGEGSSLNQLRQLTSKLNIEDQVEFVGNVNYQEIHRYHNLIDVFVSISNLEGFGVSTLEAMSCGRPVIVNDTGGFLEIVKDGKTGIIIHEVTPKKLADAIITLIKNKKYRDNICALAKEKINQEFNWLENSKNIIKFYENMTFKQ